MRIFMAVWVGQTLSSIGSYMTMIALTIWAFERTGLATSLTLIGFFAVLSGMAVALFSGLMADRMNRKG